MIHAFIKKGCFQDSVSLMIISRKLSESENVDDVSVMMGTPANKSLLETTGFWHDDFNQATPNDICVAIRTEAADESITQAILQQLDESLQQLAQASKQANETLTQTNRLLRNANGLMDGQGKQLVSDAAKTMASLQNTSTILNKLVSENKTSLNNGMQGMNELGPAVDELRRTLATLRAAVSRLEENPAALLRGRERTQEFTP